MDNSKPLDTIVSHLDSFLLKEAQTAGVVKLVKPYQPHNPNQLCKQLAPWFTEDCRLARKAFREARSVSGLFAESTKAAFKQFRRVCSRAKA